MTCIIQNDNQTGEKATVFTEIHLKNTAQIGISKYKLELHKI